MELTQQNHTSSFKNPQNIMLHIGSNDIDSGLPLNECHRKYEELLEETRNTYPNCKVFVSSILPRLENASFKHTQSRLNDLIQETCKSTTDVYYIHHNLIDKENNIKSYLFEDKVHVNKKGTSFLVYNKEIHL
uniref:Uncharacterized protein LOC102804444 n=1 Tax=Saccoglossus kowalevskii TaxID=10224 RepID=A0ABM0M601_SACKO|nr:PREDICTED: uncharacterized protein LOC102804444 [Saccoglossus kowalevskii]